MTLIDALELSDLPEQPRPGAASGAGTAYATARRPGLRPDRRPDLRPDLRPDRGGDAGLPRLPLVELVVREADLRRPRWLATQLEDVLRVRPERLVVDLSGCHGLDAAALRSLLETHRQLRRQGGRMSLRGPGPRLVRVIGLCGLTDVFDVEDAVRC